MEYEEITRKIIGCAYNVYNTMGFGFLESVYEKCLVIELRKAGLKVESQKSVPVAYEGHSVGDFTADLYQFRVTSGIKGRVRQPVGPRRKRRDRLSHPTKFVPNIIRLWYETETADIARRPPGRINRIPIQIILLSCPKPGFF